MSRLSAAEKNKPIKKENKEAADRWLNTINTHYEQYKIKFRYAIAKENYQFDEDVYGDTVIKCYDSICRKGLKDTTEQGCLDYFFKSFKQNTRRELEYARIKMRGDMPLIDRRPYESADNKIRQQVYDDYRVIYILEMVEDNFDALSFYCFRIKFLIPRMSFDRLKQITKIKDCKKRVNEVKQWLNDNIDQKKIYDDFQQQYPDYAP